MNTFCIVLYRYNLFDNAATCLSNRLHLKSPHYLKIWNYESSNGGNKEYCQPELRFFYRSLCFGNYQNCDPVQREIKMEREGANEYTLNRDVAICARETYHYPVQSSLTTIISIDRRNDVQIILAIKPETNLLLSFYPSRYSNKLIEFLQELTTCNEHICDTLPCSTLATFTNFLE